MAEPTFHAFWPSREFADLVQRMERVAKADFKRGINEQFSATAIFLVGTEFERAMDPYGRGWKPTTSRDGRTLRDTGRLQNSFTPYGRATPSTFGIGSGTKYVAVHQYGATIKAKNAPFLRFKVPYATRVFNRRSGARLKRHQVLSNWVQVQQVTIPQRQMVPEDDIGAVWMQAFTADVDAAMTTAMDNTVS